MFICLVPASHTKEFSRFCQDPSPDELHGSVFPLRVTPSETSAGHSAARIGCGLYLSDSKSLERTCGDAIKENGLGQGADLH